MNRACSVCGNEFDRSIEIIHDGKADVFDCFECAIYALAPSCSACGVKVIGHGAQVGDVVFCSAHCARTKGKVGITDRIEASVQYEAQDM